MVVALVALLVALSGSAYAALKIGTANIKDNAVTAKKIAPKAMVDDFSFSDLSLGQTRVEDFGPFKARFRCYNANEDNPGFPLAVMSGLEIVPDSPITLIREWDPESGSRNRDWEALLPGGSPPNDAAPIGGATAFEGTPTEGSYGRLSVAVKDPASRSFLIEGFLESTGTPAQCSIVAKVIAGK